MRRRAKKDGNHNAIADALKGVGASVADTSMVGDGFPDMIAGWHGRNWMLEAKDGNLSPSRQALTDEQIDFKATWRGHWAVVNSPQAAIDIVTFVPTFPDREMVLRIAEEVGLGTSTFGGWSANLAGLAAVLEFAARINKESTRW